MFSDKAKLMNNRGSAYYGIIPYLNMPAHLHRIRYYDIISDNAIVGRMRVGHKKAVFADLRFTVRSGAAIHGNEFPNNRIVANNKLGFLAGEFQILGRSRNRGSMIYFDILAYSRAVLYRNRRIDNGAFAYNNVILDNRIWPDLNVLGDLRF